MYLKLVDTFTIEKPMHFQFKTQQLQDLNTKVTFMNLQNWLNTMCYVRWGNSYSVYNKRHE